MTAATGAALLGPGAAAALGPGAACCCRSASARTSSVRATTCTNGALFQSDIFPRQALLILCFG